MSWFMILTIIFLIHALLLSMFILLEQRSPSATLSWILALIFVPFVGVFFYYLIGRMRFIHRKRQRARVLSRLDQDLELTLQKKPISFHDLPTFQKGNSTLSQQQQINEYQNQPLIRLAERVVQAPLNKNNRVQILNNGEQTFHSIGQALDQAQSYVHVAYYIFRKDKTGSWFRDKLLQCLERGVEVRLLFDGLGSMELDSEFLRPLRKSGAEVEIFLPIRLKSLIRRSYVNFRNHRKIVVIDGWIGFTGGINVGDEYQGLDPRYGFWRDTHIKIEGLAVQQLQKVFAEDWCFKTDRRLTSAKFYPIKHENPGQADVQIVPSGPDQPWYSIRLLFFVAITTATEKVWITTPYLVPDESILTALTSAALRGVDVRLLVPFKSDQAIVTYASHSYYKQLLRSGIRIYQYQKGMLHAKTMVIDGRFATIGSANMDIRSFHLNFELNALLYDEGSAEAVEATFLEDLKDAKEVNLLQHARRPLRKRLLESSARLMSPIL